MFHGKIKEKVGWTFCAKIRISNIIITHNGAVSYGT
jgi:hypothetical protein